MEGVRDMTTGSLYGKIMLFSIPLILSNFLQVFFNSSDIAVVGRFSGAEALGAVGSTTMIIGLYTWFLLGLGGGVNVIVARWIGANERDEIVKSVHTALIVCIEIGFILLAVGLFSIDGILRLLHTKSELIKGANIYLRSYLTGLPALAVYNFGNAVYSAAGNTKKPLMFLFIAGVINVIMNIIFVVPCRMGVLGVGLASAISQYVSAFCIIVSLLRENSVIRLQLSALRCDRAMAWDILRIGVPAGVQNIVFAAANLVIQSAVNSFDAVVVEGNSAAANADSLVYDVMNAFYIACASFMGQNFGTGKYDRVIKSYKISLLYSFVCGTAMGFALAVFGRQFLGIFTTESAVIEAGMMRLVVMGLTYGISAFMDCSISACRGIGESFVPTVMVILGSCVFRVIWVFTVFASYHTLPALYLLYPFSWAITAAAEIWWFMKRKKELGF